LKKAGEQESRRAGKQESRKGMDKVKNFKDLIVWQKVHQLVLDVYRMSLSFPKINII
jgi:hypothetical protein